MKADSSNSSPRKSQEALTLLRADHKHGTDDEADAEIANEVSREKAHGMARDLLVPHVLGPRRIAAG